MAAKGMTVFTHQGEDYAINDQNIATEFSPSGNYVRGDHVTYQGNLYAFKKDHPAGDWDNSHVQVKSVGYELGHNSMLAKDGSAMYEKVVNGQTVIDFNDVTLPGMYIFTTGIPKLNEPNSISQWNAMEVMVYGVGFLRQTVFNITNSNANGMNYYRYERYLNNTGWSDWYRVPSGLEMNKHVMEAKDVTLHTENDNEYYDYNDYDYAGVFLMTTNKDKLHGPGELSHGFNCLEVISYSVDNRSAFIKQRTFAITIDDEANDAKTKENTTWVRYKTLLYGWTGWVKEASRADIEDILWSLKKYNSYDVLYAYKPVEDVYSVNGVTFTWTDRKCHLQGTTLGNAMYELYRGALPDSFTPGENMYVKMNSASGHTTLRLYFYDSNWSSETRVAYFLTEDRKIAVPSIAANLIIWLGIEGEGKTVNETVDPAVLTRATSAGGGGGDVTNYNTFNYNVTQATYTVNASPQIAATSDLYLASTGDTTDRTADIMTLLQTQKVCKLGVGEFYIKTGIAMPDGTSIIGCGRGTRLILDPSVTEGYVISVGSYCSVQDVRISGSLTDLPYEEFELGGRDAIVELGDQTGFSGGGTFSHNYDKLSNLWIENFNGSGIRAYRNDGAASFLATNIDIFHCGVGINVELFSEFHAWTNIRCRWCVYACVMNGGNNLFSNCHWDVCIHLLKIDNSLGNLVNDTHSSFTNCTFCHANSNNGDAMEIIGVQNGLVFSNCQIFYSKIRMTNTKGVVLANFNFGNAENIILTGCRGINISNCIFGSDPVVELENTNGIIWTNNMTRNGAPIELASEE